MYLRHRTQAWAYFVGTLLWLVDEFVIVFLILYGYEHTDSWTKRKDPLIPARLNINIKNVYLRCGLENPDSG